MLLILYYQVDMGNNDFIILVVVVCRIANCVSLPFHHLLAIVHCVNHHTRCFLQYCVIYHTSAPIHELSLS